MAQYLQNPSNKFNLKNNWWLKSLAKYANPLPISSQLAESIKKRQANVG